MPPGRFKIIITFRVVIPLAVSSAAKDTISSKFERQICKVERLSDEMPYGNESMNEVSTTIHRVDVASFHPHESRQNVAIVAADDHRGLATLPRYDVLRSAEHRHQRPKPLGKVKDGSTATDTATKPPIHHQISRRRHRSHH